MSKSMSIFPKFDTLEYLSEELKTLGGLGALGAVILPFEKTLSDDEKEHFEERAAILEFCGGLCRVDAEIQAKKELNIFNVKI